MTRSLLRVLVCVGAVSVAPTHAQVPAPPPGVPLPAGTVAPARPPLPTALAPGAKDDPERVLLIRRHNALLAALEYWAAARAAGAFQGDPGRLVLQQCEVLRAVTDLQLELFPDPRDRVQALGLLFAYARDTEDYARGRAAAGIGGRDTLALAEAGRLDAEVRLLRARKSVRP